MPSGYLHKRCAERACEASGITPIEHAALILGAQGPDPLFMLGIFPLRPSSKPKPYGHLLHTTRTGAFLMALAQRSRDRGAVERAFAMGFLTHYALDSIVHPYVYAHSLDGQGRYSSLLHVRQESLWDTLYYRRDGHKGTSVSKPGISEARPHWEAIAAVWAQAIRDVYPETDLSEEMILTAFKGTERSNRLTHSPRGIKYGFAWAVERLLGRPMLATAQMGAPFLPREDIENAAHALWRNPAAPDEARSEGLSDLFSMAVARAGSLLSAAGQYFDREIDDGTFASIIGNLGYGTGIESKA
jgi:hypothetical protein